MPKYCKEALLKFWKEGVIEVIEDIDWILDNCRSKQERALIITLFLTGARPSELALLKKEDFQKIGNTLWVIIRTKKKGRARRIPLPLKNKYVSELWEYVKNLLLGQKAFWQYDTWFRIRNLVYRVTERKYSPYFFRHNRMSLLAIKGASAQEIKYFKGARTILSVEPYLHLSTSVMKKLRKYI